MNSNLKENFRFFPRIRFLFFTMSVFSVQIRNKNNAIFIKFDLSSLKKLSRDSRLKTSFFSLWTSVTDWLEQQWRTLIINLWKSLLHWFAFQDSHNVLLYDTMQRGRGSCATRTCADKALVGRSVLFSLSSILTRLLLSYQSFFRYYNDYAEAEDFNLRD